MNNIDIEPPCGPEMAPLYEKDSDDLQPWKAYMTLTKEGCLTFGRSFDNGQSFAVRLGVDQMWYIPPNLSKDELVAFATKLVPLFERVIRGLHVDWDERNDQERGELLPDAEEASLQIQSACDDLMEGAHYGDIGTSVLEPWEAFLGDNLEDYGLHKNSTNKEIREVAEEEIDNRRSNGQMVYGDIFGFLKRWIAESS